MSEATKLLKITYRENKTRAKLMNAPEDAEVRELCERIGYGAVMDSAARQWQKKDPIGAFACGPAMGSIERIFKP